MSKFGFLMAAAATFVAMQPAVAANFTFTQGGFANGGTISGSFTGSDLNGDGRIAFDDNPNPNPELTAFTLSFSGGSQILPFTLGLAELTTFSWDLDALLGDGDGSFGEAILTTLDFDTPYAIGRDGFGFPCDGLECARVYGRTGELDDDGNPFFAEDVSSEAVRVTAAVVPEPASWALMIGGVGLVGGALRRRGARVAIA